MPDLYNTLVRPKGTRRYPSRFERWAWSEIPAYRLGLTLGYIGLIYFGVSAFIAGVPAFVLAAPQGWTPIWATVLVIGSIVASIGSVASTKRFRALELTGTWSIFLTIAVYAATLLFIAYGTGDTSRAAVGSGFVVLSIAPGVRMLWLMARVLPKQRQG